MDKHTPLWLYLNETVPCYAGNISPNGIWKSTNPLVDAIPFVVTQLIIMIFTSTLFLIVLRPLRQPNFVVLILAGIFLGPTFLGDFLSRAEIFTMASMDILDPFAHFAMINYGFLLGLETDLSLMPRSGQMELTTAAFNTFLPCVMGSVLFFIVGSAESSSVGFAYWAVALAGTGPAILAEQLDHAKIFATDVAKTALSVAQITDLSSWALLALANSLSGGGAGTAILSTISITVFIFFCGLYMRPAMEKLVEKTSDQGVDNDEYFFCAFVAAGVGLFGFMVNTIGAHPVIGAFMFGLIIPRGALEIELFEKFEGFITWILMPFFTVTVGQRVDIGKLGSDGTGWATTVAVLLIAGMSKSIAAMISSIVTGMDSKESLTLGILMNTKSMFAIMVLKIGLEEHLLNRENFSIMVVGLLLMTLSVTPFTVMSGKKNQAPYKRRTIHKLRSKEELRLLVCLHSIHDIHSTISLFDVSGTSQESPIIAFAAHLILPHSASGASETDQILAAFDKYVQQRENITVSTFAIKSTYSVAEEDICDATEERRANLIVLPFHKQQGATGELDEMGPFREMNESVLSNAPCSVGLFIDRGLASTGKFVTRIAMIFIGGPDDREALAYAVRMAHNAELKLKVTRLIPSETAIQHQQRNRTDMEMTLDMENERDKDQDEAAINKLRESSLDNTNLSINYEDIFADNEEQVVELIREMDGKYDLFVVGKGGRHVSPLTSGLADWCEYPELGPIGDALVTTRFTSSFSVLVMQQYDPMGILNMDRPSSGSTSLPKDKEEDFES